MSEEKNEQLERVSAELVEPSALEAVSRAEIDVQIATAKRYPRSIVSFKRELLELATLDEETSESTYYSLERRDRDGNLVKIQGPSIRLAEMALSSWGNCHAAARPVAVDDRIVRAQGVCWDLQRNVRVSVEETRGIVTRGGRRYSEDMVNMTLRVASAIALRNAILRVIPKAYVDPVLEEAKKAAVGKGLTMEQRRKKILEQYSELGAKESHVLLLARRKGLDDISVDDLVHLKGLRTAILEGTTTLDQALHGIADEDTVVVKTESLSAAALKGAKVRAEDDAKPADSSKPFDTTKKDAKPVQAPEPKKAATPGKGDVPPEDRDVDELFS